VSQPDLPSIESSVDTCVTALRLADRLLDWNSGHGPAFSAKHAVVFALSCAFVTPWAEFPVLRTGTRIWSWITAIDDTVDSADRDPDQVDRLVAACRGVLDGAVPGAEPLARALADIHADVAALPGFPRLATLWRDAVDRLLTGMRFEATTGTAVASGAPPPDIDEYLEHAAYTVGVPMYMLALWSAMDSVDATALLPALRDSALAVRLANDARGHARESTERSIDALRLGVPLAALRRMVGDRVSSCRRALVPLLASDQPPAVALDRMTIWGTRLYERIDFRYPEGEGPDKREWAPLHWASTAGAERDLAPHTPQWTAQRADELVASLERGTTDPIAYPTAFVARLREASGGPVFPRALEWLRRRQWPDGSWGGTVPHPSDRLVSTLAAVGALAGAPEPWAPTAVRAGLAYLRAHPAAWRADTHELIAFELAVPYLLAEARERGLDLPYTEFADLARLRTDKLGRVPSEAWSNQATTLLYSLEVLGAGFDPAPAGRFLAANGSLGNSPSATAAYWAATGEPAALAYLRRLDAASPDGGFPEVYPIATFETAWVLHSLSRAGVLPSSARPHLARLRQQLGDTGVAAIDPDFPVPDSDDSAMVFNVLLDAGYDVGHLLDRLLVFEGADCFTTFPYERHASVSANARVLEALAHRPKAFPAQLAKIVTHLLTERRDGAWWQDKWHVSPYYATAAAVFALTRVVEPRALEGTRRWLLDTQHQDGSWGALAGTAEETAYAVLALDALAGDRPAPPSLFGAAHQRLRRWIDGPCPELWIGKGLYTPRTVVRAATLAGYAVAARRAAHPNGQGVPQPILAS
jgi:halimadienyl-diphosphate synthase